MGQKRMLWNMWRRYEVKTYTIMNASPVPFSASNSSGALDTERFLFMAWNSSFRISFEFLSDFNSSFSRAILVRYSFSARSTGFVRVMENLESHGISKKKFQAWKVMEFRSESWKVMENCYNLTFCKNRDENKENSLLSQVFV